MQLLLRSFIALLYFDFYVTRGRFPALYHAVRRCPVKPAKDAPSVRAICDAIDTASIWYWKEVLCLQRSAATTCLLRQHGIPAQMVIGAQRMPFKAHAWVEVDGNVVNDKPYTSEIFLILDRC